MLYCALFALAVLIPVAVAAPAAKPNLFLSRLRLRGIHDQPFVGHRLPEFRWQLNCDGDCWDVKQLRYRVLCFTPDGRNFLDTGDVNSSAVHHVVRQPLSALQSDSLYKWSVDVEAVVAGDQSSVLSAHGESSFQTALLDANDWEGVAWLGGGTLFRKEFEVKQMLTVATAYISGVGCFEMSIDGRKVDTKAFMEPSWTNEPPLRMLYRAYDVTDMLLGSRTSDTSPHVIGIRTGMCKYGYLGQYCVGAAGGGSALCRAITMLLSLEFDDGSTEAITTLADGTWLTTTAADPIRYSHLYHGEIYNASLENGWDKPGAELSDAWAPAVEYPFSRSSLGPLSLAIGPSIGLVETRELVGLTVVQLTNESEAVVLDFGMNMAGFASLSASSLPFGTIVVLKHGEVLKEDGTVDMAFCNGAGSACRCKKAGVCANQTDMYIARGDGASEEFMPHFTYHGFRYVQVEGLAADLLQSGTVKIVANFVASQLRNNGRVVFLDSSMDQLNKLQSAVRYTQLSNMHHVPEDCPHRGKRAKLGNAHITSLQASLNYDMPAFYRQWLQTMHDLQQLSCAGSGTSHPGPKQSACCHSAKPSFGCSFKGVHDNFTNPLGSVPDTVPYERLFGGWPGDPSWGAAAVVLPHLLVVTLGDSFPEDLYELARGYTAFLDLYADGDWKDGLVSFGYYGDWLASPGGAPKHEQVAAWSQLYAQEKLIELARAAGQDQSAEQFANVLMRLKAAYHFRFWNATANSYGVSQTATVLPLHLPGIVPRALQTHAVNSFLQSLEGDNVHLRCGITGCAVILQVLEKLGLNNRALDLALSESFPSWGFMLKEGPGTFWETWDNRTNSRNHPALSASLGPFLYSMAGLDVDRWSRRELSFRILPDVAERVRAASVSLNRITGVASFSWRLQQDRCDVEATIPHGDEASLAIVKPLGSCFRLFHGKSIVWKVCSDVAILQPVSSSRGIREVVEDDRGCVVIKVGSGTHKLSLKASSTVEIKRPNTVDSSSVVDFLIAGLFVLFVAGVGFRKQLSWH